MGKKALLIGTGPSANNKMDYDKYDLIVGVNDTCFKFKMSVCLVLEESPVDLIKDINRAHAAGELKTSSFIINNKSRIWWFPGIKKTIMPLHNYLVGVDEPDLTVIGPGLLNTYLEKNESIAVSVAATHFAITRGVTEIDLIGYEYSWHPKEDNHFYGNDFISVRRGDNEEVDLPCGRRTKVLYLRTARNLDALIRNHIRPLGIKITDYSGGILEEVDQPGSEES